MKKRIRKLLLVFLAVFTIMFIFRIVYGYVAKPTNRGNQTSFFESFDSYTRNYASKKIQSKHQANSTSSHIDQKYEKVADINSKSSEFEKEEKSIREKIKGSNALIQFEQKRGNKGNRKLQLQIGVPPNNFEVLYNELIKIGEIQSKEITKKDKTNEYKQLNAKKASLEKIRISLIDLKEKGGRIDEFISLENRILDIEEQLQSLGVNLGDFDEENEFCTIKFSVIEGKESHISFAHRLKVAFEWTIKYFFFLILIGLLAISLAYLLLLVIQKLRILERIVKE